MNYPLWALILNPSLIILGWAVIALNANRISRRNEARGLVDKVVAQLSKVEEAAITMWFDHSGSLSVKLSIETVSEGINLVEEYLLLLEDRKIKIDPKGIATPVSALRDSLTMDVEDRDKLAPVDASRKRSEISRACRRMSMDLEKAFISFYK